MLSSYFIELRTNTDYALADYDAAAGRLVHMLVSILSDPTSVSALTHDAARETCHSEVEAMLDPGPDGRELVARVVVDVVAEGPVKFDKAKWTKLVKARPEADEWKRMKINKRQVPIVPDPKTVMDLAIEDPA